MTQERKLFGWNPAEIESVYFKTDDLPENPEEIKKHKAIAEGFYLGEIGYINEQIGKIAPQLKQETLPLSLDAYTNSEIDSFIEVPKILFNHKVIELQSGKLNPDQLREELSKSLKEVQELVANSREKSISAYEKSIEYYARLARGAEKMRGEIKNASKIEEDLKKNHFFRLFSYHAAFPNLTDAMALVEGQYRDASASIQGNIGILKGYAKGKDHITARMQTRVERLAKIYEQRKILLKESSSLG